MSEEMSLLPGIMPIQFISTEPDTLPLVKHPCSDLLPEPSCAMTVPTTSITTNTTTATRSSHRIHFVDDGKLFEGHLTLHTQEMCALIRQLIRTQSTHSTHIADMQRELAYLKSHSGRYKHVGGQRVHPSSGAVGAAAASSASSSHMTHPNSQHIKLNSNDTDDSNVDREEDDFDLDESDRRDCAMLRQRVRNLEKFVALWGANMSDVCKLVDANGNLVRSTTPDAFRAYLLTLPIFRTRHEKDSVRADAAAAGLAGGTQVRAKSQTAVSPVADAHAREEAARALSRLQMLQQTVNGRFEALDAAVMGLRLLPRTSSTIASQGERARRRAESPADSSNSTRNSIHASSANSNLTGSNSAKSKISTNDSTSSDRHCETNKTKTNNIYGSSGNDVNATKHSYSTGVCDQAERAGAGEHSRESADGAGPRRGERTRNGGPRDGSDWHVGNDAEDTRRRKLTSPSLLSLTSRRPRGGTADSMTRVTTAVANGRDAAISSSSNNRSGTKNYSSTSRLSGAVNDNSHFDSDSNVSNDALHDLNSDRSDNRARWTNNTPNNVDGHNHIHYQTGNKDGNTNRSSNAYRTSGTTTRDRQGHSSRGDSNAYASFTRQSRSASGGAVDEPPRSTFDGTSLLSTQLTDLDTRMISLEEKLAQYQRTMTEQLLRLSRAVASNANSTLTAPTPFSGITHPGDTVNHEPSSRAGDDAGAATLVSSTSKTRPATLSVAPPLSVLSASRMPTAVPRSPSTHHSRTLATGLLGTLEQHQQQHQPRDRQLQQQPSFLRALSVESATPTMTTAPFSPCFAPSWLPRVPLPGQASASCEKDEQLPWRLMPGSTLSTRQMMVASCLDTACKHSASANSTVCDYISPQQPAHYPHNTSNNYIDSMNILETKSDNHEKSSINNNNDADIAHARGAANGAHPASTSTVVDAATTRSGVATAKPAGVVSMNLLSGVSASALSSPAESALPHVVKRGLDSSLSVTCAETSSSSRRSAVNSCRGKSIRENGSKRNSADKSNGNAAKGSKACAESTEMNRAGARTRQVVASDATEDEHVCARRLFTLKRPTFGVQLVERMLVSRDDLFAALDAMSS